MNDLISRKALIDIFQQKADGNSGLLRNNMLFAKKVVESMPTAYNVDKVVEQLEECETNCYIAQITTMISLTIVWIGLTWLLK